MLIEVKVPQLSESVSEATLLAWHKKQGEAVKRDENLIDIETDKVVLELPAPADGVLVSILKGDKGIVVAGEVIARIDTEGKASAAVSKKEELKKEEVKEEKSRPAPAPAVMPAAQKMAAAKGIDTAQIQGSGRDGRVTKGDVLQQPGRAGVSAEKSVEKTALQQPQAPVNTDKLLAGRPQQRVPMSRLRQRVAERLVQSQATEVILIPFNAVNMAPVMELR